MRKWEHISPLLFCLEVSAGGLTNYSMLSLYKTQFNVQRMKENKHILFYSIYEEAFSNTYDYATAAN